MDLKYSNTLIRFHIFPSVLTNPFHYLLKCLKLVVSFVGFVAISVNPDKTPHSAASDQGLHCLLRSVCSNTLGKIQ